MTESLSQWCAVSSSSLLRVWNLLLLFASTVTLTFLFLPFFWIILFAIFGYGFPDSSLGWIPTTCTSYFRWNLRRCLTLCDYFFVYGYMDSFGRFSCVVRSLMVIFPFLDVVELHLGESDICCNACCHRCFLIGTSIFLSSFDPILL